MFLLEGRGPRGMSTMTPKGPGRGEFSQPMAHHILGDENGYELFPVVNGQRVTHQLGNDGRCSRPGLHHPFLVREIHLLDHF